MHYHYTKPACIANGSCRYRDLVVTMCLIYQPVLKIGGSKTFPFSARLFGWNLDGLATIAPKDALLVLECASKCAVEGRGHVLFLCPCSTKHCVNTVFISTNLCVCAHACALDPPTATSCVYCARAEWVWGRAKTAQDEVLQYPGVVLIRQVVGCEPMCPINCLTPVIASHLGMHYNYTKPSMHSKRVMQVQA